MHTAIWLTLSLFIGAFCAALAALEGGGTRDGTWGTLPSVKLHRPDPSDTSGKGEFEMPILLWLLGIPIPLIILIMLLHH